ncbi:AAA family ATPase [Prescottella soli]
MLVVTTDNDQSSPAPAEAAARTATAARTAHRRRRRGRGPILVGIDGPAGGGKSTLADRVAAALDDAPIVRMDDLYPGWDGLAASVPLLVRCVLSPARHGRIPRYRRYDWHRAAYAEWRAVRRHRYLIVEGAGSTCGTARGYFAVRVFVDAAPDERMRRALQRDGDMFRPHWDRWARQEAALFGPDRTRRAAHIVVMTGSAGPRA